MLSNGGFILLERLRQIECSCFAPKVSWNITHREVNTEPYGPFEAQARKGEVLGCVYVRVRAFCLGGFFLFFCI